MKSDNLVRYGLAGVLLAGVGLFSLALRSDPAFFAGAPPPIAQSPLYMRDSVPPLNMLVMGKDHKIYYEAYNDASDLDGDGVLDVGYKGWVLKSPAPDDASSRYNIDYYGYFNSYACYTWQTNRFVAVATAPNKTCNGQQWSGDFLNYLTTSRMDALRRVLYGGFRQVDTDSETVLQGAFFPQDAHSWGKEYQSVARDGYNIANYAPLSALPAGRYHLFAVTTLTDSASPFPAYQAPTLRVLKNSPFRVWNWLSIEGPVAGNRCFTESNQRVDCVGAGGTTAGHPGHPANRAGFDALETSRAIDANRLGSGSVSEIDCNSNNCNPYGVQDNFLTIFAGTLRTVGRGGMADSYQFRVDGDDAIDFALYTPSGAVVPGSQIGCYNGRGFGAACTGTQVSPSITLAANTDYTFKFRHEEANGGEGYLLQVRDCVLNVVCVGAWRTISTSNVSNIRLQDVSRTTYNLAQSVGGATRDDYFVRVVACPTGQSDYHDTSCKVYPNGRSKPTGILHDYGETNKMYFGLITGSQRNNLEGGLLRRNISSFADEVDPQTGQFRAIGGQPGIARSIDRLRMIGGGYDGSVTDNSGGDSNWNWANRSWIGTNIGQNCSSQGDRDLANGECRMWGNPIGEMLFESMRYFAGANVPTSRFTATGNVNGNAEDVFLGLPEPTWRDPYSNSSTTGLGYPACSRPYQTVISDINPSYDGQMPGSAFGTFADSAVPGFSASSEGQAIWNAEYGGQRNVFIGQVGTAVVDGAPTAKSVSSMGNIRGLSPEEPSKGGTYYSASVARYARNNVLNEAANRNVRLSTYSIALASPLPRIEFPVGGRTVTLLPFAKTASGTFGGGTRKPTNTIVDFYVESIENFPGTTVNTTVNGGRPYAVFRINYEDVEQGNDHDMDAIVRYEVLANANNTLSVNLTSEYAAGSADQNMGYVLSGTTQDGIYLVVRDSDSTAGTFRPYDLNTPPNVLPGGCRGVANGACAQQLPLVSQRTFAPSATGSGAIQLRDPLWYAAKYGAPDLVNWDTSAPGAPGAGDPDNYFLVTNPLNLRNQLSKAFDDIASRNLDAGSRTIAGSRIGSESFTLQPTFQRERNGKDWTGNLSAIALKGDGTLGSTLWSARAQLPVAASRNIRTVVNVRDGTSAAATGVAAAEFQAANLGTTNADQLGKLGITPASLANGDYGSGSFTASDFVAYLRGDQTREQGRTGVGNTLRTRSSVIGSIINSEPVISAPRSDFGYGNMFRQTSDAMFSGYASNANGTGYLDIKRQRPAIAYVGANDGMLHAFNAATTPCALDPNVACPSPNAGREAFAFVPNAVLGNMGSIPVQDARYEHRYFVDGQISLGDVKSGSASAGSAWKTVLVGSAGGGARSVFALDVTSFSTDPGATDRFSNANVLWERNSSVDADIGNIYGKPLIVPLENGRWGVIFGNGYGGRRGDPSLYVLDAMTGVVISKLTADDGEPARDGGVLGGLLCRLSNLINLGTCAAQNTSPYNGLGQVTAIDKSGNGKVDTVYGGDLQGNLWKFDLSSNSESNWQVANSGNALFTAEVSGERQPITGGMRVAAGPGVGVMVYFGTGRYLFGGPSGDNNVPVNPTVQSLYAVFDDGTPVTGGRNALQAQTITGTVAANGAVTRNISRTRVIYNGPGARRGWYLDLQVNVSPAGQQPVYRPIGERFVATPRIQSGRVFFTTFTPSNDSCNPGGDNFVYALDLLSGSGALADVQVLPSQTAACTGAECGAIRIDQGGAPVTSNSVAAINPVVPITSPTGPGGCTPGVDCPTFEQCQVVVYPGAFVLPRPCGRQSWRQLR